MTVAAVIWMCIALILFVICVTYIGSFNGMRESNNILLARLEEQQNENMILKLKLAAKKDPSLFEV